MKTIQALLPEPRVKRLHLNFEPEHANIKAYSISRYLFQVRRVCQDSDFLLEPDKKSAPKQLKSELFLHAMLQLNESFGTNDGYTQCISSFKEMMVWNNQLSRKLILCTYN